MQSVFLIFNSSNEAVRNYALKLGKSNLLIIDIRISPQWWDLIFLIGKQAEIYLEDSPNQEDVMQIFLEQKSPDAEWRFFSFPILTESPSTILKESLSPVRFVREFPSDLQKLIGEMIPVPRKIAE
jgi:hypothetical protein